MTEEKLNPTFQENARRRLPDTREGITHKFTIRSREDTYKGYVTIGFYDDGTPGEIFLKLDRQLESGIGQLGQGTMASGLLDSWAVLFSMYLQYGHSLRDVCSKFRNARFEPAGQTDHPQIRFTSSPIDYVVRYLWLKCGDGTEL